MSSCGCPAGWKSWRREKFSHQRVSIESAVKMCQRRFFSSKYTSFHKNHIKLFAVYMKTASLMQNLNVLKRSL
ncbi:uncharacterized protein LOC128261735 [Drosophila gunungcola]|uniref:Uncharacterized protein n=1 Tax=Drosophila gunungcola TaxID=103775 RepID=A0A9P9YUR7_9MUSC|nr:uncharacterized protein LOC128261735 [Drosophila gunungcola]KAI8043163.1 hypothetical protein M5D96_004490 [Drosophila gunungcola]